MFCYVFVIRFCQLDTELARKKKAQLRKGFHQACLHKWGRAESTVWNVTTGQAVLGYTTKKLDKPWGANQWEILLQILPPCSCLSPTPQKTEICSITKINSFLPKPCWVSVLLQQQIANQGKTCSSCTAYLYENILMKTSTMCNECISMKIHYLKTN